MLFMQACETPEKTILQAWQRKFLPPRTICAFSKFVLGINGPGTDDSLQLLFGDKPSHNWGVMSDTMYLTVLVH